MAFPVESIIRGRYLIQSQLGTGNIGDVYLVRDQLITWKSPILFAFKEVINPNRHQDIKPANINVSFKQGMVMLVNFGVGKQYKLGLTARHSLTPYEAPEQYHGEINTLTDIYGLGATLYTLLTGIAPLDALYRASKSVDPLFPVNRMVPTVSPLVADAIHHAMSLNSGDRIPSVQQFKQALKADIIKQPRLRSRKLGILLPISVVLLIGLSIGTVYLLSMTYRGSHSATPAATSLHKNTPQTTPAPSSSTSANMAGLYNGTISSITTSLTTKMSLTEIKQNLGNISGDFTGLNVSGPLRGLVDASRRIHFTVMNVAGHPVFFFDGAIQSDGNVAGSYCTLDQKRQCSGDYGIWSVTPASPGQFF